MSRDRQFIQVPLDALDLCTTDDEECAVFRLWRMADRRRWRPFRASSRYLQTLWKMGNSRTERLLQDLIREGWVLVKVEGTRTEPRLLECVRVGELVRHPPAHPVRHPPGHSTEPPGLFDSDHKTPLKTPRKTPRKTKNHSAEPEDKLKVQTHSIMWASFAEAWKDSGRRELDPSTKGPKRKTRAQDFALLCKEAGDAEEVLTVWRWLLTADHKDALWWRDNRGGIKLAASFMIWKNYASIRDQHAARAEGKTNGFSYNYEDL